MRDRMFVTGRWLIALLGLSLALTLTAPSPIQAQTPTCIERVTDYATFTACDGTLADGRPYGFEVPTTWNGTLVIISQGYVPPGTPAPSSATTATLSETATSSWILGMFDEPVPRWLLANGCAVAASFGGTGWSIRRSMHNQIETLDILTSMFGPPTRTIPYGGSFGGIISAGLIQEHPERFAGALALSGPLAGSIGTWNQGLDFAFAIQQLLGPESGLQVVHITDPGTPFSGNWGIAYQLLTGAQGRVKGRARIALACALDDVPGWFDPLSPEPAVDDYAAREFNQFLWAREVLAGFMFGYGRADIEARSGGNPSWNTGVNYEAQLEKSVNHDEVVALYAAAGLSLEDDLARLNGAPRIEADPTAVETLSKNIVFNGDLGGLPILTLHTTGDGLVVVQQEFAYRSAALEAKDSQLLRQAFIHRGGHGPLTPAEIIAGFQALFQRIDTGRWEGSASPEGLNAAAAALGPSYNVIPLGDGSMIPTPPAYFEYDPAPFLRPYDLATPAALAARGVSEPQSVVSAANGNTLVSGRPLSAGPLPYRGGSLQVSLRAGAIAGANADVAIYDVGGRRVRQLTSADRIGSQSLRWDGRDANGVEVGSGVYFVRAKGAGQSAQLKIVVMR